MHQFRYITACFHLVFISDATPTFQALLDHAVARTASDYRPKTRRARTSHFTLFLQFLQFSRIDIYQVSHSVILAFIEFLQYNNLSHSSIQAYLSSIKKQFKLLSLPLCPFDHHSVALTLRSIALNIPAVLKKTKSIFDISPPYPPLSIFVTPSLLGPHTKLFS